MREVKVILVMVWAMMFLGLSSNDAEPESRKKSDLEYNVEVSRQIIPVYAVDSKGKPVYDLKKNELVLKINGKKVKIENLSRVSFDYEKKVRKRVAGQQPKKTVNGKPAPPRKRAIFVIVDGMYSTPYGLRKAKKIAGKLVTKKKPGDIYVIMEGDLYGGLKRLAGPEIDSAKLKKAVKRISTRPRNVPRVAGDDISTRKLQKLSIWENDKRQKDLDQKHGKIKMMFFCDFIGRIKNILDTVRIPKTVYLISEGMPAILFFENNPTVESSFFYDTDLFMRIKKMTRAIVESGSQLYTINPGRIKIYNDDVIVTSMDVELFGEDDISIFDLNLSVVNDSGVDSLKNMATGGNYYEGSADDIVTEIQQASSAFYELAFHPQTKKDMRISLKCKRKKVRVDTPAYIKRKAAYSQMSRIRKKVFAMNVVLGRRWALDMGGFEKTTLPLLSPVDDTQGTQAAERSIEIPCTETMRDAKVDTFLIRFNDDLKDADIKVSRKVFKKDLNVTFKEVKKNDRLYFLVIDPKSNKGIYQRVL